MAVGTKGNLRKATKKLGHEPQGIRLCGPFGAYGNRMIYQGAIGGILGIFLGSKLGAKKAGTNGSTMDLTANMFAVVDGGNLELWYATPLAFRMKRQLASIPLAGAVLEREDKSATVWVRVRSADGQVAPLELMTLALNKKRTLEFLDLVAQTAGTAASAAPPAPPAATA